LHITSETSARDRKIFSRKKADPLLLLYVDHFFKRRRQEIISTFDGGASQLKVAKAKLATFTIAIAEKENIFVIDHFV
jgi:hypothetical protein